MLTNEKLVQIAMVLADIANGSGSARLKYAANLNRTLIAPHFQVLEQARTEPVEGEEEWDRLREETIFSDCLRNEDDSPQVNSRGDFQFENPAAFQAKLQDLQRKQFPEVIVAQQEREKSYRQLLAEEVKITNFPYLIKWSFIEMDGPNLVGITGEQQFVLLSAEMFEGEPPWLSQTASSHETED